MPLDVRECLRAAQAAEIRGDKARAIDFLHKAADLYENAGNRPRAEQMLRQIGRLQAAPPTVVQADSGEQAAPTVPAGAIRSLEQDNTDASSGEVWSATLFQRGPTLADPALEAWCSFCCRPGKEVGALIAGPAGAYVCRGCAQESMRLLGEDPLQGDHRPRYDPHSPRMPLSPSPQSSPLPLDGNQNAERSAGRGLERELAQLITRIARQAVRPRRGLKKKRTKKRRSK